MWNLSWVSDVQWHIGNPAWIAPHEEPDVQVDWMHFVLQYMLLGSNATNAVDADPVWPFDLINMLPF